MNISGLKAHLSAHLQRVRQGEEVLICDRHRPVARIIPCSYEDYGKQQQRLVARGILAPPRKQPSPSASVSWPTPPGNVPDEIIEQLWRQAREDR
ncbi:MAG: type II toxin-antitoxin system prevent-host-death family antitoxin [Acidobacteriaceae bacterium]